jgi:hypothetical protein
MITTVLTLNIGLTKQYDIITLEEWEGTIMLAFHSSEEEVKGSY